MEEAENTGLGAELKRLLGAQAANLDRLLTAVSEEHQLEDEARRASPPSAGSGGSPERRKFHPAHVRGGASTSSIPVRSLAAVP